MDWKYEKNFTEQGYRMHYEKLKPHAYLKNQVCQYLVELIGIEPKIWRRIQVPAEYNFWDLHVAVNDAMGWLDYHTHNFGREFTIMITAMDGNTGSNWRATCSGNRI